VGSFLLSWISDVVSKVVVFWRVLWFGRFLRCDGGRWERRIFGEVEFDG
jgi:hypothetical protein